MPLQVLKYFLSPCRLFFVAPRIVFAFPLHLLIVIISGNPSFDKNGYYHKDFVDICLSVVRMLLTVRSLVLRTASINTQK